ncbi:MAG TPA: hypothetical protein PKX17_02730 [Candidatus Methanomethylicus sp.]|mgnify:CR=1 FL=1|nr:hypothetical protein [Candidatus Methanomethylicus sp.]
MSTEEADTISIEDLEAAAHADIILEREGYEGWLRRQQAAVEWLASRPGLRERVLKSIEEVA